MNKIKYGRLLLICFIVFGLACSASAGTLIPAKEMLIDRLQVMNFGYDQSFKMSSGTLDIELQNLTGAKVDTGNETVKALTGACLTLDYKLNFPDKKGRLDYQLNTRRDSYKGSLFVSDDRIILTKDVLLLLDLIEPKALDTAKYSALPPYGYYAGKEIGALWEAVPATPNAEEAGKVYRDFLVFALEAVPDKYFITSLTDRKIIFHLDQDGLADVICSVAQKVIDEKERVADMAARMAALSEPDVDAEAVRTEVLKGIENGARSGVFPVSADQVKENLDGVINLEEMTLEISLLPSGNSKFVLVAGFGDNTLGTAGKITVNGDFSGGQDNHKGSYDMVFSAREYKDDFSARVLHRFERVGADYKNNGQVRFRMTEQNGANVLLDFSVLYNSRSRSGQRVPVYVPRLTETNSMDVTRYQDEIFGIAASHA